MPIYDDVVFEGVCTDLMDAWDSFFVFMMCLFAGLTLMVSINPFSRPAETPLVVEEEGVEVIFEEDNKTIVED